MSKRLLSERGGLARGDETSEGEGRGRGGISCSGTVGIDSEVTEGSEEMKDCGSGR